MSATLEQEVPAGFRAGFVSVIGRPNVGKSTLVNALLGEKVAIVSPKPQTTRHRIYGIYQGSQVQLVLVDTPGMCSQSTPMARALRGVAGRAVVEADVCLLLTDVGGDPAGLEARERDVLRVAQQAPGPVVVAMNKIDRLAQPQTMLPLIARWHEVLNPAAVVPISALKADGLERLLGELQPLLPESAPLFPRDMHTDQAERLLCAELVREQVLLRLREEVPHCAAVLIDSFVDTREQAHKPMCHLEGRIIVERESQKAIVVGKGGSQIKALSQAARTSIEAMLGCQVFLRLTVHVDPKWTSREGALRRYGIGSEGGNL